MKKLFFSLFLLISAASVFARPEIPVSTSDNYVDPYIHASNDGLNSYRIDAYISKHEYSTKLSFINYFILTDELISLQIYFENENAYHEFTKNFDISNIEEEFINMRKKLINADIYADKIQTMAGTSTRDIVAYRPYKTIYTCYCNSKQKLSNYE